MKIIDSLGETVYGIHEVYYDENGAPKTYTVNAVDVSGEDIEELRKTLHRMTTALGKPILTPEDFITGTGV